MNVRTCSNPFFAAVAAALLILVSGCSKTAETDSAEGRELASFDNVQQAYFDYAQQNGRAPSSEQDLVPLLVQAGINPQKLLDSLGGPENVVVFWGVKLNPNSAEPIVLGYQKKSNNGRRLVMTSKGVKKMTDDEFYSATFPPGHQAPAN
ncbi:MAG: hypothetical protein MK108_13405 [Mariniblastus sp.]|nr:hypothetical protein [Mariniblastus sp.]